MMDTYRKFLKSDRWEEWEKVETNQASFDFLVHSESQISGGIRLTNG